MEKTKGEKMFNNFLREGYYAEYLEVIMNEMRENGISKDTIISICSSANARFQSYLNKI